MTEVQEKVLECIKERRIPKISEVADYIGQSYEYTVGVLITMQDQKLVGLTSDSSWPEDKENYKFVVPYEELQKHQPGVQACYARITQIRTDMVKEFGLEYIEASAVRGSPQWFQFHSIEVQRFYTSPEGQATLPPEKRKMFKKEVG